MMFFCKARVFYHRFLNFYKSRKEHAHLMRVFDVYAEAKFFQDASFSLDDLILEIDIVLVED